uniref:Secreted protein n=1 Tax=Arundo donax TaxID=35708 RepID=A0A0A9E0M0_ARUDO
MEHLVPVDFLFFILCMFHWRVDENCYLHRCCSYGALFNCLAFCESLSFYPSCHHSILQLVNLSLVKI